MNPAEIRAIFYAVIALVLLNGGAYIGFKIEAARWNVDKLAQAAALEKQQQSIIDLQKQRDALAAQVETSHEQIIANGNALTAGITSRLQSIEATVRSGSVSAAVVNSAAIQNALRGSGINDGLANAISRVGASVEKLAAACNAVDADRTSIIALEPK
jgi:hypothetical protein